MVDIVPTEDDFAGLKTGSPSKGWWGTESRISDNAITAVSHRPICHVPLTNKRQLLGSFLDPALARRLFHRQLGSQQQSCNPE